MRFLSFLILGFAWLSSTEAAPFAIGASAGADFPFSHTGRLNPGVSAEAYYRLDPYEARFHYAYVEAHYYSLLLGRKHFFSQTNMRPYIEAAIGPSIVNTPGEGLAYGLSPVFSLGVDLAINSHLSTHLNTRYSAYVYFGDTHNGDWEAHHMLSLVGGLTLWF